MMAGSGRDDGREPNELVTASADGPTPGGVKEVGEGTVGGGGVTKQCTKSEGGS